MYSGHGFDDEGDEDGADAEVRPVIEAAPSLRPRVILEQVNNLLSQMPYLLQIK